MTALVFAGFNQADSSPSVQNDNLLFYQPSSLLLDCQGLQVLDTLLLRVGGNGLADAFGKKIMSKEIQLTFFTEKKVSKKTFSYASFAPHGQYIDLELVWIQPF